MDLFVDQINRSQIPKETLGRRSHVLSDQKKGQNYEKDPLHRNGDRNLERVESSPISGKKVLPIADY